MNRSLLKAGEVADRLGLHVASIWRLVQSGNLPAPFYVAPRAARWDARELEVWLAERRMTPRQAAARCRAARVARAREAAAIEQHAGHAGTRPGDEP